LSLREIELQEEYRSDRNDIASEFFFPCLSNCIEYNRCVDFLSIQTLVTISMAFDNFVNGKAKLRIVTGYLQNSMMKNTQNRLKENKSKILKLKKLQNFLIVVKLN